METLHDMAACAEREVRMRRRVYPRWVESGRMTAAQAEREIALMDAIAAKLREEADRARRKEMLL